MENMTLIPLQGHFLPHKCHERLRIAFGVNWSLGTLWNKFMTNTKQYGGQKLTQEMWWLQMTSLGNKTSLVWIVNIKGGIDIYTKTMPFLSAYGSCIIRMMCSIFQDLGEVNGIHILCTIGI
jgi:hypothetical protein